MEFKKVNFSNLLPFSFVWKEANFFSFHSSFTFRLCSKEDQDQYLEESNMVNMHQKEELDAAEALTFLAGNFKSRWLK